MQRKTKSGDAHQTKLTVSLSNLNRKAALIEYSDLDSLVMTLEVRLKVACIWRADVGTLCFDSYIS